MLCSMSAVSKASNNYRLLRTGTAVMPVHLAFGDIPAEELSDALGAEMLEAGRVATTYNCVLLDIGGKLALVDTGLPAEDPASVEPPVVAGLRALGVSPSAVELIILSHAHADHLGGLLCNGQPVFENAEHLLSSIEWQYWVESDDPAGLQADLYAGLREEAVGTLPPLREAGLLRLVDGDTSPWSGIDVMAAPGHTPGHLAVRVTCGTDILLYIGDAFLHEVMFQHPDWMGIVDTDRTATLDTRHRLLELAASPNVMVAGSHLRDLGDVVTMDQGFRWEGRR